MPSKRAWRVRRGTMTAELMWVFPLLAVMLFGMLEAGTFLDAKMRVAGACRQGARVASFGGSYRAVVEAVRDYLGGGRFDGVRVVLSDGREPFAEVGSSQDIPSGEPIAVTVMLNTDEAVPNLLKFVGVRVGDETIVCRTVVRRE